MNLEFSLEAFKSSLEINFFLNDIGQGFFLIGHNGLALVGVTVVMVSLTIYLRPDLRNSGEALLMSWLCTFFRRTLV